MLWFKGAGGSFYYGFIKEWQGGNMSTCLLAAARVCKVSAEIACYSADICRFWDQDLQLDVRTLSKFSATVKLATPTHWLIFRCAGGWEVTTPDRKRKVIWRLNICISQASAVRSYFKRLLELASLA